MNNKMEAQKDVHYFALSLNISSEHKKYVRENLRKELQAVVKPLTDSGDIRDIFLYSLNKAVEQHGKFHVWNYLVLMEIGEGNLAPQIMQMLKEMKLPFMPDTIRMEELITTPNSSYPIPGEKARKRRRKPFYAIEYVDVSEQYLEEFQRIMIQNNGPAMKYIMVQKSWCYNFLALETVKVYYHKKDYPTWNQIHVIGLYLDSVFRYKKDFSKGLELANQISFEDNFSRLKEIRHMRYKSIGKRLS
jgi:hypothetical protein